MKFNKEYFKLTVLVVVFLTFNFIILNSLREVKEEKQVLKPKIVLIGHVYTNPYWQNVRRGAEKAAEERGAILNFEGPNNASSEEGIKFLNMAYNSKVSGIITYIQDQDKYIDTINKIIMGNIPVVTVDSDAEKSKRLAYVGTDNVEAGVIAAKEMINKIGLEGNVGIVMGGKTVKNQVERVEGFKEYISKNSNIKITNIESSDTYRLEAELAAKKILLDNVNITALFCTSALDGQGVAKAVINMGLAGRIKIICFDDLQETLYYIQTNIITSTIVQKPYLMGYKAVNIIMNNIEGKNTQGIFLTDVMVVSNINLEEYRKLQGDNNSEQ